mmetsp:Transcript_1279/g.1689  ORF Transcript_1279/g.1689 Transcript_1279/m.1689 type:complete len:317 (-) Transcript_1279:401-1351(-)
MHFLCSLITTTHVILPSHVNITVFRVKQRSLVDGARRGTKVSQGFCHHRSLWLLCPIDLFHGPIATRPLCHFACDLFWSASHQAVLFLGLNHQGSLAALYHVLNHRDVGHDEANRECQSHCAQHKSPMGQICCHLEGRCLHGCRTNPNDVPDPPSSTATESSELQATGDGVSEVKLVDSQEASEDGKHVCNNLRLPSSAALWVGPISIALTERYGRLIKVCFIPELANTTSSALHRLGEAGQGAGVEHRCPRGASRRDELVGDEVVRLCTPIANTVGRNIGIATLKEESDADQARNQYEVPTTFEARQRNATANCV